MLKDCATDDGYFYDADDAEELKETFVAIGRDLAELAISQSALQGATRANRMTPPGQDKTTAEWAIK